MATITLGGTAQVALAAAPNRMGYDIQNQSAGSLWVRDDGTAATADASSMEIPAGALYETPIGFRPTGAISIIGPTTGQAFFARSR